MADELSYSASDVYGEYGYEGNQNVTFSALDAIISNLKVSSAQIENAAIKDAHIESISAEKLKVGTVIGDVTFTGTLNGADGVFTGTVEYTNGISTVTVDESGFTIHDDQIWAYYEKAGIDLQNTSAAYRQSLQLGPIGISARDLDYFTGNENASIDFIKKGSGIIDINLDATSNFGSGAINLIGDHVTISGIGVTGNAGRSDNSANLNDEITVGRCSFDPSTIGNPTGGYGTVDIICSHGSKWNGVNNWIWQMAYTTDPTPRLLLRSRLNGYDWSAWREF